jgi:hypothetical protein
MSKKFRIKVGEKLLYIIDACEDYEISELVGQLFKSFIDDKITYDEFLKCASVLKTLNKHDFAWFVKERNRFDFDLDNVGDLIGSGLFELHYEQLDVSISDQDDHKAIRTSSGASKYKADVDGGGVSVNLSRAGEVILETFCPSYIARKTIKL